MNTALRNSIVFALLLATSLIAYVGFNFYRQIVCQYSVAYSAQFSEERISK